MPVAAAKTLQPAADGTVQTSFRFEATRMKEIRSTLSRKRWGDFVVLQLISHSFDRHKASLAVSGRLP